VGVGEDVIVPVKWEVWRILNVGYVCCAFSLHHASKR